jgi:hypothetical protein
MNRSDGCWLDAIDDRLWYRFTVCKVQGQALIRLCGSKKKLRQKIRKRSLNQSLHQARFAEPSYRASVLRRSRKNPAKSDN